MRIFFRFFDSCNTIGDTTAAIHNSPQKRHFSVAKARSIALTTVSESVGHKAIYLGQAPDELLLQSVSMDI